MRLAWIGFAFLAACGGRSQLRGTLGDAAVSPQMHVEGIMLRSCAPNDGPAYTFDLGGAVTRTCASHAGSVTPGEVLITIWSPIPSGPGTYPIADGMISSGSIAGVCATGTSDGGTECTTASHGTLVLTAFTASSGSTVAGSYSLVLPDGTVVPGSFDAVFCDDAPMCG